MRESAASGPRVIQFGVFELDLHAGELRKAGVRLSLPGQSFHVLALLLERPGDLVTREELRQRLWPTGTFVDFEHGLNAVINRLRDTLGDSADSPRYIQTVPRRGYRFIAPVDGAPERRDEQADAQLVVDKGMPAGRSTRRRKWIGAAVGITVATVLVLVATIALFRRTPPTYTPPRIMPLTRLAGSEAWPSFAPDGEQVAFAWSGEKYDNTDIYVTVVGSTSVRRLTTNPAEDYAPSWSPDGRRIAFLRRMGNAARIHVVSALGGPDLQVSEFPVGATMPNSLTTCHIGWSPDGQSIVAGRDPLSSNKGEWAGIFRIPIDGGAARALTRPEPPTFHFSPVFSPDGRRIAYASCDSPGLEASTLTPERCVVRGLEIDETGATVGAERTLTTQPVDHAGMAWSRDGKSLLFVGTGSTSVNLLRLWIDGTRNPEPVELAGSHAEHPATVASRDRLVFSRYDWDAHLYRFVPGKPLERVAASSSFEGNPQFSPDGRHIAFTSGRSGHVAIWVAAADGSEPRQLTSNRWFWQGSPNWAPDGRVIAFDAHDPDEHVHVWTIPAGGGTARRITTATGDQTAPTWSRDGKWIYYSEARAGGRDIWRVPAAGGPSEQVTRTGAGFLAYETADGMSLLYQPKYGDSPLLLMPLHGRGAPRSVVECVRPAAFALNGSTIVYVACDSGTTPRIRSVDLNDGRDRLLGTLQHFPPNLLHVNLAVSPDRKTILFTGLMRRGADLMLIEDFR